MFGFPAPCLHYRPLLHYECPIRQGLDEIRHTVLREPECPLAYALHSAPLHNAITPQIAYFSGSAIILLFSHRDII